MYQVIEKTVIQGKVEEVVIPFSTEEEAILYVHHQENAGFLGGLFKKNTVISRTIQAVKEEVPAEPEIPIKEETGMPDYDEKFEHIMSKLSAEDQVEIYKLMLREKLEEDASTNVVKEQAVKAKQSIAGFFHKLPKVNITIEKREELQED